MKKAKKKKITRKKGNELDKLDFLKIVATRFFFFFFFFFFFDNSDFLKLRFSKKLCPVKAHLSPFFENWAPFYSLFYFLTQNYSELYPKNINAFVLQLLNMRYSNTSIAT